MKDGEVFYDPISDNLLLYSGGCPNYHSLVYYETEWMHFTLVSDKCIESLVKIGEL